MLRLLFGICSTPITVIKGRSVSIVTLVANFESIEDNCLLKLGWEARCGDVDAAVDEVYSPLSL